MENNEENLGSQEPTTQPTQATENQQSNKPANTRLIGMVAVAVVAILAIIFIFFTFIARSPKAVVKDYIGAFSKGNAKKVMNLMDYEAVAAFTQLSKSYSTEKKAYVYKFEDFDEKYEDAIETVKDLDKDQKKAYEETKDDAVDALQKVLDPIKENKIKMSVKKVKTEKVDDSKKLTKVTATIEIKADGEKMEEDVVFYTVKKGLKNYVAFTDFNM